MEVWKSLQYTCCTVAEIPPDTEDSGFQGQSKEMKQAIVEWAVLRKPVDCLGNEQKVGRSKEPAPKIGLAAY